MTSGDVVFEATNMNVLHNLSGRGPRRPYASTSDDGYEAGLAGSNGLSHESYIYDIVVHNETSPFDVTKTYDVIIKEH
jgi:hypothetical protein